MVIAFEQSAVLATAWANDPVVKLMAVNHAVARIPNKVRINRCCLHAFIWIHVQVCWACCSCQWSLHAGGLESLGLGAVKENAEQVGHAVKHLGLRPSLPMMRQAVDSFFALALPRKHEVCSSMSEYIWMCAVVCLMLVVKVAMHMGMWFYLGMRSKFHAKAMLKLVFAFSRIAKWLGLSPHRMQHLEGCLAFPLCYCQLLRRGHFPKEKRIQLIYEISGMGLPGHCLAFLPT